MKNKILIVLFVCLIPTAALSFPGDSVTPMDPYEYTDAIAYANGMAAACAQVMADVATSPALPFDPDIANKRLLAYVGCQNAANALKSIVEEMVKRPYNPTGPTIKP